MTRAIAGGRRRGARRRRRALGRRAARRRAARLARRRGRLRADAGPATRPLPADRPSRKPRRDLPDGADLLAAFERAAAGRARPPGADRQRGRQGAARRPYRGLGRAPRHPPSGRRRASRRRRAARRPVRTELVGLGELGRPWEMIVAPLADGSRLVRLADQSQARAAEQMRVDFVANASHELRTPLATLLGFSKRCRTRRRSTPETRAALPRDHVRRGDADARPARRSDVAVADRGRALRAAARHGRPACR